MIQIGETCTVVRCLDGIAMEKGVVADPHPAEYAQLVCSMRQGLRDGNVPLSNYSAPHLVYMMWREDVVRMHLARSFTASHDRLPSIAAMARELSELTGDTYCAGLWLSDLPRGLLWGAIRPRNDWRISLGDLIRQLHSSVYVAPSWSPYRRESSVSFYAGLYNPGEDWHLSSECMQLNVKMKVDVINPWAKVSPGCHISLDVRVLRLQQDQYRMKWQETSFLRRLQIWTLDDQYLMDLQLDYDPELTHEASKFTQPGLVMILLASSCRSPEDEGERMGLLRKAKDDSHCPGTDDTRRTFSSCSSSSSGACRGCWWSWSGRESGAWEELVGSQDNEFFSQKLWNDGGGSKTVHNPCPSCRHCQSCCRKQKVGPGHNRNVWGIVAMDATATLGVPQETVNLSAQMFLRLGTFASRIENGGGMAVFDNCPYELSLLI